MRHHPQRNPPEDRHYRATRSLQAGVPWLAIQVHHRGAAPRLALDPDPHLLKRSTFSKAAVFTADNEGPANSSRPATPPSPHCRRLCTERLHHHYVAERTTVAIQSRRGRNPASSLNDSPTVAVRSPCVSARLLSPNSERVAELCSSPVAVRAGRRTRPVVPSPYDTTTGTRTCTRQRGVVCRLNIYRVAGQSTDLRRHEYSSSMYNKRGNTIKLVFLYYPLPYHGRYQPRVDIKKDFFYINPCIRRQQGESAFCALGTSKQLASGEAIILQYSMVSLSISHPTLSQRNNICSYVFDGFGDDVDW